MAFPWAQRRHLPDDQEAAGLELGQRVSAGLHRQGVSHLLNLGDNFSDFVDNYRGSEAERLKVFEDNRERWGREWITLANPSYGSFESAPFGHDYKKSAEDQRKAKREVLQSWSGP